MERASFDRLPPDVIVSCILPCIEVCVDNASTYPAPSMVRVWTRLRNAYTMWPRETALYGYFKASRMRSIWFIFRSLHVYTHVLLTPRQVQNLRIDKHCVGFDRVLPHLVLCRHLEVPVTSFIAEARVESLSLRSVGPWVRGPRDGPIALCGTVRELSVKSTTVLDRVAWGTDTSQLRKLRVRRPVLTTPAAGVVNAGLHGVDGGEQEHRRGDPDDGQQRPCRATADLLEHQWDILRP